MILGPKGSGKSAIGSKLEINAQQSDKTCLVKCYPLENFPYNRFSDIIPCREAPETKYPDNWEFVLMVASLNSFVNDSSFKFPSKSTEILQTLIKLNLLSLDSKISLEKIVKTTTDKKFKVTLHGIGYESSSSQEKISDVKKLYTSLQECFYSIKIKSKHLIIIDGLDNVLTHREKQYKSLSSLIVAADKINKRFYRSSLDAKIIIMCRTDLFDKLSEPNKNKIKQTAGIVLDWYQNTSDLKSTNLARLINLRAEISLKTSIDVFDTFLPTEIYHGGRERKTTQVLFDYTRHLPRDIILLFNEIQKHSDDYGMVSKSAVQSALVTYSRDYFISEIKDHLCGFLNDEEIEKTFQLIAKIGKYRFNIHKLGEAAQSEDRFSSIYLNNMLNALFDCNAIGNVEINSTHVTFKYRNQYAEFNPKQDIIVHYGLQKVLNLNRAQ